MNASPSAMVIGIPRRTPMKWPLQFVYECVACVARRSNSYRIRPALERWSKRLAERVAPFGKMRTIRTRYGFRLRVDVTQLIGKTLFTTGEWEPTTTRVVRAMLSPGDVCIDIGCNIGYFGLLASRCVGPAGKVIAFEPAPGVRRQLQTNLALNRVSNLTLHDVAASNAAGEVTFHEVTDENSGLSSMRPDAGGTSVQVKCAPLDAILPPDAKPSFMKIDVEGAEQMVIDGAAATLDRCRPDVVIEVTDRFLRTMGSSTLRLCETFLKRAYKMYMLDRGGVRPVTGDLAKLPEQFDALFTHRDSLPASLRVDPAWNG